MSLSLSQVKRCFQATGVVDQCGDHWIDSTAFRFTGAYRMYPESRSLEDVDMRYRVSVQYRISHHRM
jgi:hypothetical protein